MKKEIKNKEHFKGFDQIKIKGLNITNFDVYNNLKNINPEKENLSIKNKNILNKIKSSYEKNINNETLDNDEYILSEFELFELSKLENTHFIRYLIYRYIYNMYPRLKIVEDFPPCVQLEPTSKCNFRCIMCYQSDLSFSAKKNGFMGDMSFDIFKKVVDEIEGNVEAVTFASRGEPTLSRLLPDFLDYTKGKFLGLKVNTNASMLNEKMIHCLLSSDLQTIVFSVDSPNPDEYEKIRVKSNFKKLMKNIELFHEIKEKSYKDSKHIIRISGVKMSEGQTVNKMEIKFGKFADFIGFTNMTPWQSSYDNEINDIKDPCTQLWTRLLLRHDGTANPCDYDYKDKLSKFNVKNLTIKEIWKHKSYTHYRNLHLEGNRKDLYPCNRCLSTGK